MLKIFAEKITQPNSLSKEWLPNTYAVEYTLNNLLTPKSQMTENEYLTVVNTLNSIKNSIADYVKIITKKKIPVRYHDKDTSYTDNQSIVISGNLNDGNIDATVGIVMHESSHIVYTDFKVIQKLVAVVNSSYRKSIDVERKITDLANTYKLDVQTVSDTMKQLVNIFEDRRIDHNTTHAYPAFMDYYVALYYRYFNNVEKTLAFRSNLYNDEAVESYMFRLINMINPYASPDALNGLPEIYKLVDLKNIGRFNNTEEILDLSFKVIKIIYDNCKQEDGSVKKESDNPSNDMGSGEGEHSLGDGVIYIDSLDDIIFSDDPNAVPLDMKKIIFSEKAKKQLMERMKKQQEEMDGEKEKLNKDFTIVNDLQDNHCSVQSGLIGDYDVIFIDKVSESNISDGTYQFFSRTPNNENYVAEGIAFGKILYKKVNVLNEIKIEKQIRKDRGHINKRLLHELPSNNTNIFNRIKTTEYGEYNLHISIDTSGSMDGSKLKQCVKTVTALCTLSHMLGNKFSICVSIRYHSKHPVVAILYDSTKDKYLKALHVLKYLDANGGTPEGLCFNALKKYILKNVKDKTPYFINFSDGEPTYSYEQYTGIEHTRDMVISMRKSGITVLSYFITDRMNNDYSKNNFIEMYGKDSKMIDHNSIPLVAKTLNDMFLGSLHSKMA